MEKKSTKSVNDAAVELASSRLLSRGTDPKKADFTAYKNAVYELIAIMEGQRLTGCELSFKDGWKFKLEHPKRQKILREGGNPYPQSKL